MAAVQTAQGGLAGVHQWAAKLESPQDRAYAILGAAGGLNTYNQRKEKK